jgi:hypothetical protein
MVREWCLATVFSLHSLLRATSIGACLRTNGGHLEIKSFIMFKDVTWRTSFQTIGFHQLACVVSSRCGRSRVCACEMSAHAKASSTASLVVFTQRNRHRKPSDSATIRILRVELEAADWREHRDLQLTTQTHINVWDEIAQTLNCQRSWLRPSIKLKNEDSLRTKPA